MSQFAVKRNLAGNCLTFEGSSNPVFFNNTVRAEINADNSNNINVVNDIRTGTGNPDQYEFWDVPYTTFCDEDGGDFASAQAAVDYINDRARVLDTTGRFILDANDTLDFFTDETRTSIFVDNGLTFPIGSLTAAANDDNHINITSSSGDLIIFRDLRLANASINGSTVTQTLATGVNELNSLFDQSGGTTAPTITSSGTITIDEGDIINYEATIGGGDVTAFEWTNLPEGVTQVINQPSKIIGGSNLSDGTYNISVRAHNYVGVAKKDIVLTVTPVASEFSNGLSTRFQNLDSATRNRQSGEFTNLAKAAGSSSSAYTLSFWFKPGNNSHLNQNIFNAWSQGGTFAGTNVIQVMYNGNTSTTRNIRFNVQDQSGGLDKDNYRLDLSTPVGDVRHTNGSNGFHHIVVTNSGGANAYQVSTLGIKIYINGVEQTLTDNSAGGGLPDAGIGSNTFSITPNKIALGRQPTSVRFLRDGQIDELAFWNSELNQSQITTLYNSGSPSDLASFSPSPAHWYRMGDGDTFPTLSDSIGNADLDMNNMSASDFVSDTP